MLPYRNGILQYRQPHGDVPCPLSDSSANVLVVSEYDNLSTRRMIWFRNLCQTRLRFALVSDLIHISSQPKLPSYHLSPRHLNQIISRPRLGPFLHRSHTRTLLPLLPPIPHPLPSPSTHTPHRAQRSTTYNTRRRSQ